MVTVDNLPSKLCAIISAEDNTANPQEWRLLGEEKDGFLLFSWTHYTEDLNGHTKIGIYSYLKNIFTILYSFENIQVVIQASINCDKTLLGFVTKETVVDDDKEDEEEEEFVMVYNVFIANLKNNIVYNFNIERTKQIMIQFLYKKQSVFSDNQTDKFLLFIHKECASLYEISVSDDLNTFTITSDCFKSEVLVQGFIWAQWDSLHQVLYYIHYRKPTRNLIEGEENEEFNDNKTSLTLSGLQFHDDLPHETLLNIPMNLPHLIAALKSSKSNIYEDDTVPLRVHDCSLDLHVISDSNGIICICHHYLYQPTSMELTKSDKDDESNSVHFAYSVTLLNHSCIIHCVVPGIPWMRAKLLQPMFKIYGDHHLMVFIPGLFTHLLDIGVSHEPSCHIVLKNLLYNYESINIRLVPLSYLNNMAMNINTLELVPLHVKKSHLVESFKIDTHVDNKISIIHYLLVHEGDIDTAAELLSTYSEKPMYLGLSQLLKEFLIASAFASVQRNLPSDASQLVNLLSVTTQEPGKETEITMNKVAVRLSQDKLWNTAMMLLSPQQRIIPYCVDMWTKLWENLTATNKIKAKFRPCQVADKLMVSLMCYQPEALSRSSTPLSPGGPLSSSMDMSLISNQNKKNQVDSLPFYEFESCTASKQEHIISVNLRELSMHLLKQSVGNNPLSKKHWQSQTPIHVHAVATRYVAAQLEQSRYLCQLICRTINLDSRYDNEKGFVLINLLPSDKQHLLFLLLERYYLAVESIAFPLPQGFTSFFTYLGYQILPFDIFLQYVNRNVFELQVDVMKVILINTNDDKEGILQKLKLLSLLPRSRAKRLLNAWSHPVSLMIRGREHALNILSGVEGTQPRARGLQQTQTNQLGLAAFPSADRLSPLDTFLDLLTAKASLAELDFGLLIEATIASTNEFFKMSLKPHF